MREHHGHIWVFLSIVFRSHSVADVDKDNFKKKKKTMKKGGPRGNSKHKVGHIPSHLLLHGPPTAPFAPNTHTNNKIK